MCFVGVGSCLGRLGILGGLDDAAACLLPSSREGEVASRPGAIGWSAPRPVSFTNDGRHWLCRLVLPARNTIYVTIHKRRISTDIQQSSIASPRSIISSNNVRQTRRLKPRLHCTLPLQRKRFLNRTPPRHFLDLPLPLLAFIRPPTPEIFPMSRHAVRNTPLPFVELNRLHRFDTAHQRFSLSLARRTELFEFPALVRMRDEFAVD